jgi:hypothetical protein
MNEQTIDQLRRGDPGHDEHVVVGQIRSVSPGWEVPGHYIARFVVGCRFWDRKTGKRRLTSYQCCVYDSQAKLFEELEFKKGDTVLVRLEDLRLEAYLDAEGQPRASMRAFVGKFLDLRPRLDGGPGGPVEARSGASRAGAPPLREAFPGLPPEDIINSFIQAGPSDPPLPIWADPPLAAKTAPLASGGFAAGPGDLERIFNDYPSLFESPPERAYLPTAIPKARKVSLVMVGPDPAPERPSPKPSGPKP